MRIASLQRVPAVIIIACYGCYSSTDKAMIEQGLCQNDPDNPCCPGSPIIIDVAGNGFDLTDVMDGVRFPLNPSGDPEQISWTSPGSDDAWLALDRNANGVIDNGSELFGNFTSQPASDSRQGYLALRVFDLNNDNVIDNRDPVFSRLRLWQDRNHDGVSGTDELSMLAVNGIEGLGLTVTGERQVDEHGNLFRYSAHVFRAPGSHVGALSYDVFLVTELLAREVRDQGVSVSMATAEPEGFCGGGDGGGGRGEGGGGITDPSIFYQYGTIGGAVCRAVCWAAGSAVCAAVSLACAIGSTVTVGGLVIPCTAAILSACAAGGGGASICSDLVCPAVGLVEE